MRIFKICMQATSDIDYKLLYDESQLRILTLEQQLLNLQKMIFASRHERFTGSNENPAQLSLDIAPETSAPVQAPGAQKISYTRLTTAPSIPVVHPGRMKLPEHLRREEIIIEPTQDITGCKHIGQEITEVLEYEPGELFVKKYVRNKYALPQNSGVAIGELPSRPLEKAMAGEGLLAQIIIDKYIDHRVL